MKYFELKKLVELVRPMVVNMRVDKIDLIGKQTLQIRLNQRQEARKLFIIAQSQEFFFADEKRLEAPKLPSQVAMAFRKYLEGAVLEDVEIIPNDRIVKISFKKYPSEIFFLYFEFFGTCNFVLTDADQQILALLKQFKDKYRDIKIHKTYILPESHVGAVVNPVSNSCKETPSPVDSEGDILNEQRKRFWENLEKEQSNSQIKGNEKVQMLQEVILKKYLRQKDEFAKKGKHILENLDEIQQEFEKSRENRLKSFKFGLLVFSADKTPPQQAQDFFDKSKKLKEKIAKIEQILKKIEKAKRKKNMLTHLEKMLEVKECAEFYAKYHWFFSSEGILCFGGRSAEQNEDVLRTLVKSDDIVLHTDTPGSPFFIIQSNRRKISEQTIQEAAQATVSYSRYWRSGALEGIADVFTPNQIKKTKNLATGTFLIKGKIKKVRAILEIAIGIKKADDEISQYGDKEWREIDENEREIDKDGREIDENRREVEVIGGPTAAILKQARKYIILQPGKISRPETLKRISEALRVPKPAIEKFLPSGEYKIIF